MSNNDKSNTSTLPTLNTEELTTVTGGFGWKQLAAAAVSPGATAAYYGGKALYNHGKDTGAQC